MRTDGCLELESGRFRAAGIGLDGARRRADLWLATGPSLGLSAQIFPRVRLRADALALLPLARERYGVNGSELVHRTPGWSFRGALGLSFVLN